MPSDRRPPGIRAGDVRVLTSVDARPIGDTMGAPEDRTRARTRRTPDPARRAAACTAVVVGLAAALFATGPARDSGGVRGILLLAVAFGVAELAVVHVHLRRETFSFSLSEVALAVAIVHAAPGEVVGGQLLGLAVALTLHRRQPLVKLLFNLGQASVAAQIAMFVANEAAYGNELLSAPGLAAVLLGVVASSLVSGFLVQGIISVVAGRASWRNAPNMLLSNAIAGLGSGCLALQAVALVDVSAWGIVPVVVSSAVVLAAYRGYAGERQRSRQVEVVHDTGRVFQAQPMLGPAVLEYLDRLRSTFNSEHALLVSVEPTGVTVTAVGPGDHWAPTTEVGATGGVDLAALVAGEGTARPFSTDHELDRWVGARQDMADGIVAPLHTGAVEAVLVVGGRLGDVGAYTARDVRLLALLADQLAVILDNRRLTHAATHDPLTGLANRRLLEDRLRTAADGGSGRHALLLLDLDGFKTVNDTLGHGAGDEVLTVVAQRLERIVRRTDVVARLGGDEFAVLLVDLPDRELAVETAERVVATIAHPMTIDGTVPAIGVSVGVAVLRDGGEPPGRWKERADAALYAAKRSGKGRHVVAGEADDHPVDLAKPPG